MRVVLDTSALMENLEGIKLLVGKEEVYIPTIVLEELDGLKESKKTKQAYKARQAIKFIEANENKFEFIVTDKTPTIMSFALHEGYDQNKNDNKILFSCMPLMANILTYDIAIKAKAKDLGIDIYDLEKESEEYKGYRYVSGDTDSIAEFYSKLDSGEIKLLTNQYLVVENTDTDQTTEQRFDGEKLVALKLPPQKVAKGLNSLQRCALDILNNKDIPIKIIAGNFGSGKTLLSMKMAQYLIDNGTYQKMLLVRNPNPADDIDIGALPGGIDEKVGKYFKPMLQYIENGDEFPNDDDKKQCYIETEIVSYMKGISVNDTVMIVDEAEDLNTKLLKMVGTRLGKNSAGIFCGDYKQSEKKYKEDNGLNTLIEKKKGNPLVGIIILEEDVRSSASKVFADI